MVILSLLLALSTVKTQCITQQDNLLPPLPDINFTFSPLNMVHLKISAVFVSQINKNKEADGFGNRVLRRFNGILSPRKADGLIPELAHTTILL